MRVKSRDEAAWAQLAALYSPMVYRWARVAGLQAPDAQDVVQNVFLAVVSAIDRFQRSRPGDSFRGWLWKISRDTIVNHRRYMETQATAAGGSAAQYHLQQVSGPEPDSDEASRDAECRVRHRALGMLRGEFEKHIWEAFHRVVVHGDHPTDVARDLRISVATVYRAKFRVLARLRSKLDGL